MPKCICLITCQGASLDQATQNWTLFSTVEQVSTPFLGVPHPLETITFWHVPDAELNKKFKLRLVLETENGNQRAAETPELEFVAGARRHRLRILGFPFPATPGHYVAKVEWRSAESATWQKEAAEWRVEINAAPMPVEIAKPIAAIPKQ